MKNLHKNLNSIWYLALFCCLFYCAICYRSEMSNGVIFAIDYCLKTLIPSLFPMIFISCAISNSPACRVICWIFQPLCRYVLKMPKACACAVIFGLLSGYPVGAKLTSILLKEGKINEEQASRLLCFCINPGLPFCAVFVGGVIFQNIYIGLYMFFATALASLIIGFLWGIGKKIPPKILTEEKENTVTEILSKSATASLSSTLTMCLYIVIFSAFIPLITIFSSCELSPIFWFAIEVTKAVTNASLSHASCEIFVIGLAFGGICIHFQVFSFFKTVNYFKFYISRFLHCFLSFYIFKVILYFFPIEKNVSSTITNYTQNYSETTYIASFFLILLACAFIFINKSVEKKN